MRFMRIQCVGMAAILTITTTAQAQCRASAGASRSAMSSGSSSSRLGGSMIAGGAYAHALAMQSAATSSVGGYQYGPMMSAEAMVYSAAGYDFPQPQDASHYSPNRNNGDGYIAGDELDDLSPQERRAAIKAEKRALAQARAAKLAEAKAAKKAEANAKSLTNRLAALGGETASTTRAKSPSPR